MDNGLHSRAEHADQPVGVEVTPRRAVWKKSIAVIQTAADPPNQGRIIFAIMGWIWKSRKALTKIVEAKRGISG
jgi:hypothetical protein